MLDPGVADQDVDAAELGGDLVDAGLDLRLVGDVHRDRRRDAAAARDLAGDLLGGSQVEVGDGDLRASRAANRRAICRRSRWPNRSRWRPSRQS